jgi:hypothetical protein
MTIQLEKVVAFKVQLLQEKLQELIAAEATTDTTVTET